MQKNNNESTLSIFEFPNGITVETDYDHITIRYGDEELLHWVDDEWREDETTTTSIASWIAFAALHSRDEVLEELGYRRCDKYGHAQGKLEVCPVLNVCESCTDKMAALWKARRDGAGN